MSLGIYAPPQPNMEGSAILEPGGVGLKFLNSLLDL